LCRNTPGTATAIARTVREGNIPGGMGATLTDGDEMIKRGIAFGDTFPANVTAPTVTFGNGKNAEVFNDQSAPTDPIAAANISAHLPCPFGMIGLPKFGLASVISRVFSVPLEVVFSALFTMLRIVHTLTGEPLISVSHMSLPVARADSLAIGRKKNFTIGQPLFAVCLVIRRCSGSDLVAMLNVISLFSLPIYVRMHSTVLTALHNNAGTTFIPVAIPATNPGIVIRERFLKAAQTARLQLFAHGILPTNGSAPQGWRWMLNHTDVNPLGHMQTENRHMHRLCDSALTV
jgi:hypothetical protein